jgi:23S rRNA pseudouridine2605 synthase
MFEALGYQVSRLIRIRFGDVLLPPRLTRGKWSELDAKETERLMSSAGLSSPGRQTERKPDAKSARVRRKTKSRPD